MVVAIFISKPLNEPNNVNNKFYRTIFRSDPYPNQPLRILSFTWAKRRIALLFHFFVAIANFTTMEVRLLLWLWLWLWLWLLQWQVIELNCPFIVWSKCLKISDAKQILTDVCFESAHFVASKERVRCEPFLRLLRHLGSIYHSQNGVRECYWGLATYTE